MKKFGFLLGLAFVSVLLMTGAADAQTDKTNAPILPQMACEALLGADLSHLPDAATQIVSAEVVTNTGTTPYCHVTGYSAPQIQWDVRLPTTTWTGRYIQVGCGGFCGAADLEQTVQFDYENNFGPCVPENLGEFVVGLNNSGHIGRDAQWAGNAPQLRVDWAYRSEHVMATVAQALIAAFYGQEPTYRYFTGCSNGGRQGLVLAQRYPTDFNGIVVGGPAHLFVSLMIEMAWTARTNTDADGNPILTGDALKVLHEAAVAACDDVDGLKDDLISDPRTCDFTPDQVACTGPAQSACLTDAQVAVARKLYAGPTTANGQRLYPSGLPIGSELEWNFLFFGWDPPRSPGFSEYMADNYLRYLASWDKPLTLETLRFDPATFAQLAEMSTLYDASDPDLSAFRDAGGKLILWHGWEDASIPPQGTISYYEAVQTEMGGAEATQQFARLYLVPGLAHCTGGTATPQFDFLTPLMAWVETDRAPQEVIVTLGDRTQSTRTRPIYPYPTVARYDGSGSPDEASNFGPFTPTQLPKPVEWAGVFRAGEEQWCQIVGKELQCGKTPAR
ncbi:MAG: tannase/feruloyl esterase family alpha/beta hydrolase [Caldilinea sp. CFX5]|nr:tannase/feruloyl esterase family alpha/beta hydrolase [Caldilinea sp. CFX5]